MYMYIYIYIHIYIYIYTLSVNNKSSPICAKILFTQLCDKGTSICQYRLNEREQTPSQKDLKRPESRCIFTE